MAYRPKSTSPASLIPANAIPKRQQHQTKVETALSDRGRLLLRRGEGKISAYRFDSLQFGRPLQIFVELFKTKISSWSGRVACPRPAAEEKSWGKLPFPTARF